MEHQQSGPHGLHADAAGTFAFPGTSLSVNRLGYGAMRPAGANVWGPPRDVDAAELLTWFLTAM